MYFAILAGAPLASLLDGEAPLWTGFWSDTGDRPGPAACIDRLVAGAIPRALAASNATPAETALCERLVLLAVDGDGDTLGELVRDVAAGR